MFQERSFVGSKISLPKPEIFYDESDKFLVVATPWGARTSATKLVQTIVDYYSASRTDSEATSPFKRLTNLSTAANNLRISVLLANEILYRDENRDEYRSGVELFTAVQTQSELVWIQVGHPNLLLGRRDRSLLLPLSMQFDLSAEMSRSSGVGPGDDLPTMPALASQLLGVDPFPNISIHSFRPMENDSLILVSRSWLSEKFLLAPSGRRNLDDLSKLLVDAHLSPFWLGVWDL